MTGDLFQVWGRGEQVCEGVREREEWNACGSSFV